MSIARKCFYCFIWFLLFGSCLFADVDRTETYIFNYYISYYGIEHLGDPYAIMNNPALAAASGRNGLGMISLSSNDWFLYKPLSLNAVIPLGERMDIGLAFHHIELPITTGTTVTGSAENHFYDLTAAMAFHYGADISLGFSTKYVRDSYIMEPGGESTHYLDYDIGLLAQWPVLSTLNKGKVNVFDHAMQIDVTPGIQCVWKNLAQSPRRNYSAFVNGSLYDEDLNRTWLELTVAYGDQYGVKLGLMNLVNLYNEKPNGLLGSNVYELEVNMTQLIGDALDLVKRSHKESKFLNHTELLLSYGTWDLSSSIAWNNYNLNLKWKF